RRARRGARAGHDRRPAASRRPRRERVRSAALGRPSRDDDRGGGLPVSAPARLALLGLAAWAAVTPARAQQTRPSADGRYRGHEIAGAVENPPRHLRVETALGSVTARGTASTEVRYRIRVRAKGGDDAATRRLLDDVQVSAGLVDGVLLF